MVDSHEQYAYKFGFGGQRVATESSGEQPLDAIMRNGVRGAPDVAALEVLGLEESSSAGFVALDSLLRSNLAMSGPAMAATSNTHSLETGGAD